MDDSEIFTLLAKRQESAVSEMLVKYGKICRKISGNQLHSNEDAEEIVNDAMLTAWNRIPPEKPNYICAFLCKITRNLSLKRLEYQTAQKRISTAEAVSLDELAEVLCSKEDSPEEQYNAAALAKAISDFLSKQKLRNQQLFVRRYYAAESFTDLKAWADVQRTQMALDPSYDTFTDFGISIHWRKSNGFIYSHFTDHGTEDGHEQLFSSLQMVCTTDDFHTVLVQIRLLPLNHSGDERAVINHFSMLLRKENSIVTILDFEDALFRPLATGNDTVTDILDKNYSCVRQNNEISLDSENYWNTETSEQELAEMRKYAAAVADQEPMHKKLHEYIAENFDMLWHTGLLELNKETNEMYYEDETNLTYNHLCIYDDPVGSYYYGEEPQERTVEHNFISSIFMTDKPSGSCVIQVTDTKDDDAYYVYMIFLDTNNHVYVLIRPDEDSFTCEPFIGSH